MNSKIPFAVTAQVLQEFLNIKKRFFFHFSNLTIEVALSRSKWPNNMLHIIFQVLGSSNNSAFAAIFLKLKKRQKKSIFAHLGPTFNQFGAYFAQ